MRLGNWGILRTRGFSGRGPSPLCPDINKVAASSSGSLSVVAFGELRILQFEIRCVTDEFNSGLVST